MMLEEIGARIADRDQRAAEARARGRDDVAEAIDGDTAIVRQLLTQLDAVTFARDELAGVVDALRASRAAEMAAIAATVPQPKPRKAKPEGATQP